MKLLPLLVVGCVFVPRGASSLELSFGKTLTISLNSSLLVVPPPCPFNRTVCTFDEVLEANEGKAGFGPTDVVATR